VGEHCHLPMPMLDVSVLECASHLMDCVKYPSFLSFMFIGFDSLKYSHRASFQHLNFEHYHSQPSIHVHDFILLSDSICNQHD